MRNKSYLLSFTYLTFWCNKYACPKLFGCPIFIDCSRKILLRCGSSILLNSFQRSFQNIYNTKIQLLTIYHILAPTLAGENMIFLKTPPRPIDLNQFPKEFLAPNLGVDPFYTSESLFLYPFLFHLIPNLIHFLFTFIICLHTLVLICQTLPFDILASTKSCNVTGFVAIIQDNISLSKYVIPFISS